MPNIITFDGFFDSESDILKPRWLPTAGIRAGGLSMHVNKVDHVTTVERVAARLGESVDFIHDVALEMDTEDGVIWVYGIGDDGVLAFTDFGIETLVELIEIHKDLKSSAGA